MISIAGKWALVTGSSRGIGQQVASGLARHGCNVAIHARDAGHAEKTAALVKDTGVQTYTVAGDLGTQAGVEAVIQAVKAGPGSVDILYNNAAIQGPQRDLYEFEPADWDQVFQVNVWAVIALCRAFAPEMKARGFGRIVNLTSGIKDQPGLAPYSVSKAAVDKYTKDLAAELAGTNVLANYLDPGWLRTDMGGPSAMFDVESVLPGALVPALLDDHGPSGQFFYAH